MSWFKRVKDSVKNFVSDPVGHVDSLINDTKDWLSDNSGVVGAGAGYTAAALGAGATLGPLAPVALAGLGYLGGKVAPDAVDYVKNRGSALIDNLTGYTANEQFNKTYEQSERQFAANMEMQLNQYRNMVKDMSAAGLSPLSSLSASPASGVSGNTASPTASGSSIGQLSGFLSPILGAIMNKSIANADNETRLAIAHIQANQSAANAATAAGTARRGQDINAPAAAASARAQNASAANQEYETDYKKNKGYISDTPDSVKTTREVVNLVKEANDYVDSVTAKGKSTGNTQTIRNDCESLFKRVSNGSDTLSNGKKKYKFGQLYLMWSSSVTDMTFEQFLQRMVPQQMSAYYEREKR